MQNGSPDRSLHRTSRVPLRSGEVVVVDILIWVLVSLLAMVAVSITVVVLVVRAVVKRIRRNRALAAAALRTRARLSSGPQRKVLELRVQLKETLDSGQAAVDIAGRSGGPRGELPRALPAHRARGGGARPATPPHGERDRVRRADRGAPVARSARGGGDRPGASPALGRRSRNRRPHGRHPRRAAAPTWTARSPRCRPGSRSCAH